MTVINHANQLDLRIGGRYPPQGDHGDFVFDGAIDDVRFYARALTPDELSRPENLPATSAAHRF